MADPGLFPYVVLVLWLPASLAAFARLRPAAALVVAVVGGTLFLPEAVAFDAPLVPPLGKHDIAPLCGLVGCMAYARSRIRRARPGRGLDLLLILLVLASVPAVLSNPEVVAAEPPIRGLTWRDVLAVGIRDLLRVSLPFLLGRAVVESHDDLRELRRVLVGLGVLYSLFALFEVRFSPNLHRWIYGFHARDDFSQALRWGGWRPTVFLDHGLAVAVFFLVAAVLACAESRLQRWRWGLPAPVWAAYLAAVLVVCRSTGAIVLGLALLPLALWARPGRQLQVAALVALLCAAYPLLKIAGGFPEQALVDVAGRVTSEDRARSLAYRFQNDRLLVERARHKLLFGWGPFGRNRVYDERGESVATTDGYWIIQLGVRGVVGLTCTFGLLLAPIFLCWRRQRQVEDPALHLEIAALALIVAGCTFDLLPNGLFNTLPFFLAGALARVAQFLGREGGLPP